MAAFEALVRVSVYAVPAVNPLVMVPLAVAPLIPYSMEVTAWAFAAPAVKLNWIVLLGRRVWRRGRLDGRGR
jgi:hypothetical protein